MFFDNFFNADDNHAHILLMLLETTRYRLSVIFVI